MVSRPKTMTLINPRVKRLWWATPWKPAISTCIFPPSGDGLLVITGWKWVAKGALHPKTSLWLIWLPRLRWRQQHVCKHSHWAEWSGKANRKLLQSKSCTLLLKTTHFKRCNFYCGGFRFVLHFPVCFTTRLVGRMFTGREVTSQLERQPAEPTTKRLPLSSSTNLTVG